MLDHLAGGDGAGPQAALEAGAFAAGRKKARGEEVACSFRPEQAYALPPGTPDEVAPEDPEAAEVV